MKTKLEDGSVSILEQTVSSLQIDADRLRMAHVRVRSGEWKEPLLEPENVLLLAAEKVERFRLGLIRFARQSGVAIRHTATPEDY
jgi:hypothetical protein